MSLSSIFQQQNTMIFLYIVYSLYCISVKSYLNVYKVAIWLFTIFLFYRSKNKKFTEAVNIYQSITNLNDYSSLCGFALSLLACGMLDEACAALNQVIAKQKDFVRTFCKCDGCDYYFKTF